MQRPTFKHKGKVFEFSEHPTVAQVEIVSDLLHEARAGYVREMEAQASDGQVNMIELSVKVSDIIQQLRRERKTAAFVAACVNQEEHPWTAESYKENSSRFNEISYEESEQVIAFFFSGGWFAKIVMPSFLTVPVAEAAKSTAKPKR